MSDGLSFEDFVALDDGVAIGPGANGLVIDLNSLHPPSDDDDVDIENDDNEYSLKSHITKSTQIMIVRKYTDHDRKKVHRS